MSFISMFFYSFNPSQAGWIFMWIIATAAILCLAAAIERFIFLNAKSINKPAVLVKDLTLLIENNDLGSARVLAENAKNTALGQVLVPVLQEATNGAEQIRNAADEATLRVIPQLEKRTAFLGTIGNLATLLGLMGTIYGLIIAFAAVGKPGIDAVEKSTLLAQGIAAAMNTTYMGLMVAIPSIALYTFFKGMAQKITDQIDEYTLKMVNLLIERSYRTHKYNITASQIKEGVGLHVTHNNIKIFADNKLVKEINI